ncbi:hypothetical protein NYY89_20125, partial [Acinetobacter baumannii]|nr:hypothetical protein [Acinetobacter baumannii]
PAAKQTEQIPRPDLAVGGFQDATQASIVVPVGRRGIEHVTQRLFERIVHKKPLASDLKDEGKILRVT